MSLIERQVAASAKENAINKKVVQNAYKAVVEAKKFKETRQPRKVVYGKNSLLDKIITSSLKDSATNKRLEQIAVSAINGQRQSEQTYKPEGVQMLGQMGREKPLTAITKEMIKEYQDEERAKPFMIDGEARKYMGATYEPQFPVPFEELKSTDRLETVLKDLYKERTDVSNEIKTIDDDIKETTEKIATLKKQINTKLPNFGNLFNLRKENGKLEQLKEQRKKVENSMDKVIYNIKNYSDNIEEIKKSNALLNQKNRDEVIKYEQSLNAANRNRLNLQQQPYESEYDYYKRLKEVEKEKFDPVLYKQYAANEATKKLKINMDDLFSDASFKEEVIKNINDENKFMINKLFDKVGKKYLDEYGYNNTRLSPKMTAAALTTILNSVKGNAAAQLQAIMKRRPQQEIYSDTIELARDREGLAERQAASRQQAAAATQLQARMKRRPQREKYSDTIDMQEKQKEIFNRQSQRLARYEEKQAAAAAAAAAEQNAALRLQSVMRGYKGRQTTRTKRQEEQQQIREAEQIASQLREAATRQREARAENAIMQPRISKAQSIGQRLAQAEQEQQLNTIQQAQQLARELRRQDKEKEKAEKEIAKQKEIAKERLSSALLRSKIQPVLREAIQEKKEAAKRQRKAERVAIANQYIRNQKLYLDDIESRLPYIEAYLKQHEEGQEKEIAPQKELINRELKKQQATPIIKQFLKDNKNKSQIMEAVRKAISNRQKPIYVSSPGSLAALSTATTVAAEQEQAGLRKPRSDFGEPRGPYMTRKKQAEELKKTIETFPPKQAKELKKMLKDVQLEEAKAKSRSQALDAALKRPGMKNLQDIGRELPDIEEDEPMAKTREPKKGKGLKKPTKRRDKISASDKKKDRLRLVISQIKAGNTNPRLIVEVNKLYKDLYNIENAFMMLK